MQKIDTVEREKIGKRASVIGIIANIFLAVSKIVVGILSGMVSIIADGLNNLSDSVSSLVAYISFRLSSKPADEEHPFGHERIEYITSMAVAFLILVVAFELLHESINKIIAGGVAQFSIPMLVVLAFSIVVKLALFFYNRAVAKRIDSDVLKATAVDSVSDCFATALVLVSVIVGHFTAFNLDGYAGILIALFIGYSGIKVLGEAFSKLIGQAPTAEMREDIKKRILAHSEVLGIHDLWVYSYGPNKYFASVHIELDARVDVMTSHELVDEIEREFLENTSVILTGHLDPIEIDNPEVNAMRERIFALVKNIDERFSAHDFRMVKGPTRTNLIFDIAVPYDCSIKKEEIEQKVVEEVSKMDGKFFPVITIEHQTL